MKIFRKKAKTIIISIISILIVASTWMFNIGWLRLLFMPVAAILHSILFFYINLHSADYFDKSKKIKVLNVLFIVTYIISYVFMPDSDDISSYAFWGMVHDESILNTAQIVSAVAFIGNIVTFVLQITGIEKIKKELAGRK